MAHFRTLDDIDVRHKTVLVRADLNLPLQNGVVTDTTRVKRLTPTLQDLIQKQAKIIILSHFGRPKGTYCKADSLKQLLPTLESVIGHPLLFAPDCIGPQTEKMAKDLQPGQILLLENLRFHGEEEKNDLDFAKTLAKLGDIYVNDAFSCSHRAHASVVAITQFLPAIVGRGMQQEREALSRIIDHPQRPLMAIVAGSKVSTKLDLLQNLIQKVDLLVVGGGMANTFLNALGHPIGQSLQEESMKKTAQTIIAQAQACGCHVILPLDVAVTTEIKSQAYRRVVPIDQVQSEDKIVDVGDATVATIRDHLSSCQTVVWNGPIGIFEIPPFDKGTVLVAQAIADQTRNNKLVSVAGGGDTLAALAHAGCAEDFTYTSTAGGAFLEWLEGKPLPGLIALEKE